jgi:hypothetical protein
MSATGSTRLVPIEDRVALTLLRERKPAYAPYIAAIQAAANQFMAPIGFIAYGVKLGKLKQSDLDSYIMYAAPPFVQALSPLGVNANFAGTVGVDEVTVTWTVSKSGNSKAGSYTITGQAPDFSGDYAESKNLAYARWTRYAQFLTPEVVDKIFEAAKQGYQDFMSEGAVGPRKAMAMIKHSLRLDAVDRKFYIGQIQNSAEKYPTGYQYGVEKYKTVFVWVGDALKGAFYLTRDVFEVL